MAIIYLSESKVLLITFHIYYELHGGDSFLRSNQALSHFRISKILWNPKVHYHVHKSPPMSPILSQINPVHNIQYCLYYIHFNIILPTMSRSS
jgi:hypothetical protein